MAKKNFRGYFLPHTVDFEHFSQSFKMAEVVKTTTMPTIEGLVNVQETGNDFVKRRNFNMSTCRVEWQHVLNAPCKYAIN